LQLSIEQPIGIFDSGIGGLTVANAIVNLLPHERIIYFGDTAHFPYGDKSARSIRSYSIKIAEHLVQNGCKMIVIACNTASALSFNLLQKHFGNKVLITNVIDPVVKVATQNHETNQIGVIGTKATIRSGVYARKLKQQKATLTVRSQATPLLAPMIEEGYFDNNISQTIINSYLSKTFFQNIQSLVLACTHYPMIKREIENYYQSRVKVHDSTQAVAQEVMNVLEKKQLLSHTRKGNHQFYVSDYTDSFEKTTKIFYREKIHLEHYPIWDK
jgi:glutamate racemase